MTKPIYVLNGPNLNRLGTREPHIYGTTTLKDVEAMCRTEAGTQPIEFRQTNSETQLIDWVHEAIDKGGGIIINPAAYTFTSLALFDALKMFPGPIIELHISNIHKREVDVSQLVCVEGRHRDHRRARRQGLFRRRARDARSDRVVRFRAAGRTSACRRSQSGSRRTTHRSDRRSSPRSRGSR